MKRLEEIKQRCEAAVKRFKLSNEICFEKHVEFVGHCYQDIPDLVKALEVAVERLNEILVEYAEDPYDKEYIPHYIPAFKLSNQALAEIKTILGENDG